MRCINVNPKHGQCQLEAMEGLKFCVLHSKDPERPQRVGYNLINYQYRTRYNTFLEDDEVRSLRREVALARMALEQRLNLIQNGAEFIAASDDVNKLFITIKNLTESCHKLETSLGSLLSRPALLRIIQEIVVILNDNLVSIPNHEVLIDKICEHILETIENETSRVTEETKS